MSEEAPKYTRRGALKGIGMVGAASAIGGVASAAANPGDAREQIADLVQRTALVDTHEHLPDEEQRLRGEIVCCDDWSVLFSQYLESDFLAAGMPDETRNQVFSRETDPVEKWRLLAPYWPAVKNTGYARAVRIAMAELYGIGELDEKVIPRLQDAYDSLRRPGMYQKVLVEAAGIESCQVNYLWRPFRESRQPTFLMQDISLHGMHFHPEIDNYAGPAGRTVNDLADWHGVIDWWFDTYAKYAVAVKSQAAYGRGLDYEDIPPERAEPVFRKILQEEEVTPAERKELEDHLFWYAVRRADEHRLPVKLPVNGRVSQDRRDAVLAIPAHRPLTARHDILELQDAALLPVHHDRERIVDRHADGGDAELPRHVPRYRRALVVLCLPPE